jgi:serine protease Do
MISNLSRAPWAPVRRFAADQELTIQQLGALWHLDARVQLGASGGAVLDTQGRFVGLTTSLAALEGYESSVGYAIPFTAGLRRVVATLLDGYEVEYGFLGIAPRTSFDRAPRTPDGLPTTAAEVLHVAVDAPAAQAGLRVGDYVIGVNDAPVFTDDDLVREIGLLGPGAAARLEVLRGERRLTIEAPLGKWPVYDDTQIIAARSRYSPWRGLVIDWPTARRRFIPTELFERYVQAVVITEVVPDSPAARAGLQAGMFIASVEGRRTPTPTEFAAATRPFAEGEVRLVRDDGREITISAGP